ncbi:hypothetical protein CCR75_004132 [Bremia lactucae]|uniref:Condensin complex subunit 2 n=1 Tax=Bremia lactucae TaxID=4779 RepID=A0A976FIR0_BRELC|nr:hypothetical protein CCR75_004132 [Bremia lactucae]
MDATGGEIKSEGESAEEPYAITEDENEHEDTTRSLRDSFSRNTSKRKRLAAPNDEDEISRRRRRRRSLAYQQRRRSITPSEKKTTVVGGTGKISVAPARSKQYISDMYSTIIKMSSENKINVKNSWSLHLIDHMEDILQSSKRVVADGGDADDDTYNFQRASCTLDASVKIYSYRVDDTWNSSYKILENLSRTEQKHGHDELSEHPSHTVRKTRKALARTIEKNLNNINLKVYDTECQADPLFHKMSQSFDEGGAKGMLLANLSVYDGCKILLNSSDVSVVTRKSIQKNVVTKKKRAGDVEGAKEQEVLNEEAGQKILMELNEDDIVEGISSITNSGELTVDVVKSVVTEAKEDQEKKGGEVKDGQKRISLSLFSGLSCMSENVETLQVCPPLHQMYAQLDALYGDENRHKLGIKNDFLRQTPVKGRRQTIEQQDVVIRNLAGILETACEEEVDGLGMDQDDDEHDVSMDFGEETATLGVEEASVVESVPTIDDVVNEAHEDVVEVEKTTNVIDLASSDDDSAFHDTLLDGTATHPQRLDKDSSLLASAADFFRAKANENMPKDYETNLFSQMIESALFRSTTLEEELNHELRNDYSYFDVKLLRNWAGPGHWKFPAVRKVHMKKLIKDEVEKDGLVGIEEDEIAMKAEMYETVTDRVRKASAVSVEKKTVATVDFFGEKPDFSRLQAPKSALSLEVTKGVIKKQVENALDLVLPVDTHIELGLFFRHFLKEKMRFFRKRGGMESSYRDNPLMNEVKFKDSYSDNGDYQDRKEPFAYNEDTGGFEPDYDEDDESPVEADDHGTEALYSVENLVQANRVVEKIGVHYERFAKRVDVKKLKSSIWDHLEKKVIPSGTNDAGNEPSTNDSGKRPFDCLHETGGDEIFETSFENVVENVANKVPSNVTVSFYFICVLHLANEKGLELVGQDNLCDFRIRKE